MAPVTLRELIAHLINISEETPESLDYLVVTSRDDEGNGFNVVFYHPSITSVGEIRDMGVDIENFTAIDNETPIVTIN